NLASVGAVPAAGYHPALGEPIHELDHTVMPKLYPLGKRADGHRPPPGECLHLKEQQILLRLDARAPGRHFAKPKKPPDVIPERGKRPVGDLGCPAGALTRVPSHWRIIS